MIKQIHYPLSTIHYPNSGVSLVEVVVAMLILSLIVAGGYAVFISGAKLVKGQGLRFEALNLARQQADILLSYGNKTVNYWTLPASGTITLSGNITSFGASGTYTVNNGTVGNISAGDMYKIISVNVVWTEPSP